MPKYVWSCHECGGRTDEFDVPERGVILCVPCADQRMRNFGRINRPTDAEALEWANSNARRVAQERQGRIEAALA